MSEYRQRSRSPYHSPDTQKSERRDRHRHRHHHDGRRSSSPKHDRHSHKRKRQDTDSRTIEPPQTLPFDATFLSKHDLSKYRPLFTLYLDIQKQLDIDDIPEDEARGRWKSFVKKWNAGDLAEGWYDPKTFEKAERGTFGVRDDNNSRPKDTKAGSNISARHRNRDRDRDPGTGTDDEDDEFGPSLPAQPSGISTSLTTGNKPGPAIPSSSDLQLRNEQAREDADTLRSARQQHLRLERKAEHKAQVARLDELNPRAEGGTRERQLEKKQEVTASNRAFAAAKEAGGDVELRDADVMGDEDSLGELRLMKEMEQRKKTEREIRRDEILRTRVAEREERVKGMREKEAKTMEMLKSIARARFGAGEGSDAG